MAILKLPESLYDGLRLYFGLKEGKRKRVFNVAKSTLSIDSGFDELKDKIADSESYSETDSDLLANMFFSIAIGPIDTERSFSEFMEDFLAALTEKADKTLEPHPNFEEEMSAIFHSLEQRIKAVRLAHKREALVSETKILTDIRPVFNSGKIETVRSLTILHTLSIDFQKNGKEEKTYLAMNNDDLQELKQQIIRAEQKEQVLRATFEEVNIDFVDIKNGI